MPSTAGSGHARRFRASLFEFRPYPGTPEWHRLIATGKYQSGQLLDYTAVDLTSDGLDQAMRGRDEFNFSVNIQFGEATVAQVQTRIVASGTPAERKATNPQLKLDVE